MIRSSISDTMARQRLFFQSGQTRNVDFRISQLRALKQGIQANEHSILAAVKCDMNRPELEGYVSEIGTVLSEIDWTIKNLKKWAKPRKVRTPMVHFPASSWIHPQPLGVALIIGPWNYPFQLLMSPLIGAISAGNCAVLKPSEVALRSSHRIAEIIRSTFHPDYVSVVEGDAETARALLAERFDHIFYTGGTRTGREVMQAAADNITPVTLELGGKSPCIVDREAHLRHAARRLVWGKFFNAGQTCIAPDYVLADRAIKKELLQEIKEAIAEFYGDEPLASPDYGRVVNDEHFERLCGLARRRRHRCRR